ncbi:MAG: ATP-binding protein, partial [Flavobacteriales bacterium]
DEGPGFDYDNLPDPTDPQNIEKPHGRGVFLMKNLSDKIDFIDGGSTVKIEFNVGKKPE